MEIGDRIKAARESAGYNSQRAFAADLGVSHGMVGAWESHRKKPGRDLLLKIARLTGVDVKELVDGPQGKEPADPLRSALHRRIDRLSRRQQKNLLELLDMASDVGRVFEKKTHPVESE